MSHKKQTAGRPGRKPGKVAQKNQAGGSAAKWILLAGLIVSTLIVYAPARHGGLLWDDDGHITRPELQSAAGLGRIWFDLTATQQYYPVTHTAFWLQHLLWGDGTEGYHLVNVLLHALAAFLVALVLMRLEVPWAWLAALIFALHPVHVESVAWITELKNTLSGVFYLSAALAYLHFDDKRNKKFYWAALALFVLALLSKSVTATLPAALLVVFWWKRGRLAGRADVLPLIPFFALGIAGGLLTNWIERAVIGASGAEYAFTFVERCLIAGRVTWFYLGKLVWPANLIFIYPRWQISQAAAWQYVYPAALIVLIAALWWLRRRSRAPLAAVLYFCGTLFPALGFFNVFPFRYSFVADHFQYLASIGIIALFCGALPVLVRRWKAQQRRAAVAAAIVIAGPLAVLAWSQSRQYVDGETLYRATIRRNPACWMAYTNLGMALQEKGLDGEAVEMYRQALNRKPDVAEIHSDLGNALQRMGRLEEAVAEYEEALRLKPNMAEALSNLGITLQGMGRVQEAIARYKDALRLKPNLAVGHNNLGYAFQSLGRLEEAVAEYREALRITPEYDDARANLVKAQEELSKKGK
jgi:tetratricopeptide (TPR) repeat protein